MTSFIRCSSAPKLQENVPDGLTEVYYQEWSSGVRGGTSGLNLIIGTSDANLQLDSVYFRGKQAKLVLSSNETRTYIARFTNAPNYKDDIVLDKDPKKEYGNTPPVLKKSISFELKNDECVISYKQGNNTNYFKIVKLEKKTSLDQPM